MCCCIPDTPIDDVKGRYKNRRTGNYFQFRMVDAPLHNCSAFSWFCGQCFPPTCGCTQYMLRRKILEDDMTKYICCQGYFNSPCIRAGHCWESKCPHFCLCLESCLCNACAVSSSRIYIMDKYKLSSDPCDYQMIRINNAIQALACLCDILALFIRELRDVARLIDFIADVIYHLISGCMTAQVAMELDYQYQQRSGSGGYYTEADEVTPLQYGNVVSNTSTATSNKIPFKSSNSSI